MIFYFAIILVEAMLFICVVETCVLHRIVRIPLERNMFCVFSASQIYLFQLEDPSSLASVLVLVYLSVKRVQY